MFATHCRKVSWWVVLLSVFLAGGSVLAQGSSQPDWMRFDAETLQHFQALLRFDTTDPPGNEQPAADYLKQVLEREGIQVQVFALEPSRLNVVARLKGNGKKRPILLMGHTDVVSVDPRKWTFPPFSATRDDGYVYGRGSLDDRPHVVGGLMMLLMLKRLNVPLDRDVIFLAEAGEENTTRVGIEFMVNQHYPEIDAQYGFAEGGRVIRSGGQVKGAAVDLLEKNQRTIVLTARGASGHGSFPLKTNAIVHLSAAVAAVGAWQPPIRLNETTRAYFERLASVSSPEDAARYRSLLSPQTAAAAAAAEYLREHDPRHAAMLRTTVSPTIIEGGYRVNIIPSEAKATLDVKMLPDEDPAAFLEQVRKVVNDPAVDVSYGPRDLVPNTKSSSLDSEAFRVIEAAVLKHYGTATLPTMLPGLTDMPYLRAKGMQCYGIGPGIDSEDAAKGFGFHSDQERILEAELLRFVRFQWDIVVDLAQAK